jgi:hypothetical protein
MSRAPIRKLKKIMQVGLRPEASQAQSLDAREAALALLRRSVALKHDRLAILRLVDAVKLEATIESEVWRYCGTIASAAANMDQFESLFAGYFKSATNKGNCMNARPCSETQMRTKAK